MAIVKEVRSSIVSQISNGGRIVSAQVDDEFDIEDRVKKASQLLDGFKEVISDNKEENVLSAK